MGILYSVVQQDIESKRYIRIDGEDNLSSSRVEYLLDKHDLDYVTHGFGISARDYYFCPQCEYIVWVYLDSLVGSKCWDCQATNLGALKSDTINAISCASTDDSEISYEIKDDVVRSNARIRNINYINNYAAAFQSSYWKYGPVKIDFNDADTRSEKLVRITIKSCLLNKVVHLDHTVEHTHSWVEIETASAYYIAHFRFLRGEILVCMRRINSIMDCDKEGIDAAGQKQPCHVWNEPFCRLYNNNRHFFPSASNAPSIGNVIEWIRIEGFHPKYHLLADSISQHFAKSLFTEF